MMKILAIIIAKMLIFIGKLFNRGSVISGNIAIRIDKKILYKLKLPKDIIVVTGSSGKGSTTKMIAEVYKRSGYTVAYNETGSNVRDGVLTMLLANSTITGRIKKDIVIIEMDERWAKYVLPIINPTYVVITNLTRDQPPRQGNVDVVFEDIKKALKPNMHLVLNADDPYLQKFNLNNDYQVTYYGINKNKYSYLENKFENLNLTRCPKCNRKLNYDFYHFENIGSYRCENNDFKRPDALYNITNLDYNNNTITINKKYNIKIPFGMLFTCYNTLAAFTVLSLNKLDDKKITTFLNEIPLSNSYFESFKQKKRMVYTLNNKNENSTTFNQSMLFIDRNKEEKTIVIGWKEISRRYKFNDLSWLYDINFELLNNHKIEKIVCIGKEQFDIATRIKLAGFEVNKIVCFLSLEEACLYLKRKTKSNIFAVLNFDFIEPFNKYMKGDKR